MLLIEWGHIPPSGGPYRQEYLLANGREALGVAIREYEKVLTILGEASTLPIMHTPLVEGDRKKRLVIQAKKAAEWLAFRGTVDEDTIAKLAPHIRQSELAAVAALNFLEDHELADTAHAAIHRASFVRGGLLGCIVTVRDDELWTGCSMQIHQLRFGASVGMVSDFACSICGEPMEDCDHLADHMYPKVASRNKDAKCNICYAEECGHREGETYEARAHGIALNIKSGEISIVDRPRYPMARITELELELGDVSGHPDLLKAARDGELHCQVCLGPCEGFIKFSEWDPRRWQSAPVDHDGDSSTRMS